MEANGTSAPEVDEIVIEVASIYLVTDIRIESCRISDSFMGKAGDVVYSHKTGQKAIPRQPHPSTRLQHIAELYLACPKPQKTWM